MGYDTGDIDNSYTRGSILFLANRAFVGGVIGSYVSGEVSSIYTNTTLFPLTQDLSERKLKKLEWTIGGLVAHNGLEEASSEENYPIKSYWNETRLACNNEERVDRTTGGKAVSDEYLQKCPDSSISDCNLIYKRWNASIWDFGADDDYPSLK